jgi:hypothetical protein
VAVPCSEQLRAGDLRVRIAAAPPRLVVADHRSAGALEGSGFEGPVLLVPDSGLWQAEPAPAVELDPEEPALVVFTSGTASGVPRPVRHAQRYLTGQSVQAEHWLGVQAGELCWCTGASGWSKSARNVFAAPWLRGATALVEDRAFDAQERLATLEREGVQVLCMTPTEYPSGGQAGAAAGIARAAARRGGGRAPQPRGRGSMAGLLRRRHPRRLRPDRDGRSHRHADRRARPSRLHGAPAARISRLGRRRRAVRRPGDRADLLPRRPGGSVAHGGPGARGRRRLPLVRGTHG